MSEQEERDSYIYYHIDPRDSMVKYIGIGKFDRAWSIRRNQRKDSHVVWLEELFKEGYTLSDIVVIRYNQITKQEALLKEKVLINEIKPLYNSLSNTDYWSKNRTYDKELATFAGALHDMGYGYINTALLMGGDRNKHMTIKRMIQNA